jgi:hypothetical protein
MYEIIAITPLVVNVGFDSAGQFIFASNEFLKQIDGFSYDPDFGKLSEFIEYSGPGLIQVGPSILLSFNSETNLLEAVSRFHTERELSESELSSFLDSYKGQMSDGFGSGMNQDLSSEYEPDFEVYWLYNKNMLPRINQEKIVA